MEPRAALLSGEHATLPEAELRALLGVHDSGARVEVRGLQATVEPSRPAATDAALRRLAMAHGSGVLWGEAPDSDTGVADLARTVRSRADGEGSVAIRLERRGLPKSATAAAAVRTLGDALKAAGHPIELEAPQRRFFLWSLDGRLAFGELMHDVDRAAYGARAVESRPHFQPVSLHPRLAAALLHLARVRPGGRVYDPFCGTGGFVLEAAREGYDAWGSDLDAFMVQGTLEALADTADEPLTGAAFVADVGETPRLLDGVDGIVTDLPYGRASTTAREALSSLYDRAFAAFADLLPRGAHAVVGGPEARLLAGLERHGFRTVELHEQRVHNSLTRHFAAVMRV
ncbi:MAG TPA: hypothetical protein VI796_06160 [Candidatus Thermoplasmatota archaeon]|nr:hypothetical protein [Candidatus Thermoplasmatota archaeon]